MHTTWLAFFNSCCFFWLTSLNLELIKKLTKQSSSWGLNLSGLRDTVLGRCWELPANCNRPTLYIVSRADEKRWSCNTLWKGVFELILNSKQLETTDSNDTKLCLWNLRVANPLTQVGHIYAYDLGLISEVWDISWSSSLEKKSTTRPMKIFIDSLNIRYYIIILTRLAVILFLLKGNIKFNIGFCKLKT